MVRRQVDPLLAPELVDYVVDDGLVHVGAAQLRVARRAENLEHAAAHLHDGHVERAAAKVEHEYLHVLAGLVEAKRERGGRRLVDYAHHIQTRYRARVLCGLALVVVKVGRYGNDGLFNGFADERLGVLFDLLQYERRYLLGLVLFALHEERMVGAHLALGLPDGVLGVCDGLAARRLADEQLPVPCECNDRRERLAAYRRPLGRRYDGRLAAHHYGRRRVARSQINAYYLGHPITYPLLRAFSK